MEKKMKRSFACKWGHPLRVKYRLFLSKCRHYKFKLADFKKICNMVLKKSWTLAYFSFFTTKIAKIMRYQPQVSH